MFYDWYEVGVLLGCDILKYLIRCIDNRRLVGCCWNGRFWIVVFYFFSCKRVFVKDSICCVGYIMELVVGGRDREKYKL